VGAAPLLNAGKIPYTKRTMARIRDGCPACGEHHPEDVLVCPITGVSLRFSDPRKAEGEVIGGKYRIGRLLGRGGMGAVYEAEHIELAKKVAVKILLPESSVKPHQVERFKREARSAASLGHDHIVDIFDLDTSEDGSVFIVMEYLEGYDLADLIIRTAGPIPVHRAAHIACQAARGLGRAHEHDIVHRDLKPENVFLVQKEAGDLVKIVDFGIAMMRAQGDAGRLTAEGVLIGTPFYMSPEQARGERDLDPRTDVYALGTVLFEMLTGKVPFDGDTYLEILAKHQVDPPPTLHEVEPTLRCPAEMEGMLRAMLAKDRDERPGSMREVEQVLSRFAVDPSGRTLPADEEGGTSRDGFAETLVSYRSGVPGSQDGAEVRWSDDARESDAAGGGTSRRRWPLLLAALGGAALLAVGTAFAVVMTKGGEKEPERFAINAPERSPPPEPEPAAQAVERVSIDVEVRPQTASLVIDGEVQEGTEAHLEVDRGRSVTVRAEAPGHVTMEKEILADRDRAISWSLEPLAREPARAGKRAGKKTAPPPAPEPKTIDKKKKKVKVDKENPYLGGT
jgi:serine/threonine-protein kinase